MDQPKNLESVVLIENALKCEYTRVCWENDQLGWIELLGDRCHSESPIEFLECQFSLPHPFPFDFPKGYWLLTSRFAIPWLASHICLPQNVCKRKCHLDIFLDGPSTKVHEFKEHPDIANWLQCWPVINCGNPVRLRADTIRNDNKPQKTEFWNSKLALLGFAIEVEFFQSVQHWVHILLMLRHVCRMDEYDINIAYHKVINAWLKGNPRPKTGI